MKLRLLLFPLSLIYGLINDVRNILFRIGFLKIHQLPVKVISVGNLCAGGTGKTPFVMTLIELLTPEFSHIAVISRGYGRRSKGAKIVSIKGTIKSSVNESGDEPFTIAKRFPQTSVIVAEKRIEGYNLLLSESENDLPDLIILDDGFQHQYIARDLNICLMNGNEPYKTDLVLPAGNLREFKRNLNRADCLVETKYKSNTANFVLPYFYTDYKKSIFSGNLNDSEIILVSGIAKPRHFESLIKQTNTLFKSHYTFSDHHNYTHSDFTFLNDADQIITTEKDYYKLLNLGLKNNIVYLKIDFEFPEELNQFIMKKLFIHD